MYTIGIDLGGTHIAVGLVDENYNIVKKISAPTIAQRGPYEITKDMAALSAKVCEECGLNLLRDVKKVGIAAPGTVNPSTGLIEYSNNIKMRDFPVIKKFAEYSGVAEEDIAIGNDANLAALGEATSGAAKGAECAVMITLGTGVGGGVVMNGKLLTGCAFGGAELGHTIIEYGGRQCSCGNKGCFEAYSSASALVALTREKFAEKRSPIVAEMCENDPMKIGGKTAFAAMRKGCPDSAEVVKYYISHLATGIANLINIFQPNVFLIGGGVCNEGDPLLLPLKEEVRHLIYSADKILKTDIRIATLGNDAGIIGAAALARK
jgi:glucokinase